MNPRINHDGKWWISTKAFVNDWHIRWKMFFWVVLFPIVFTVLIAFLFFAFKNIDVLSMHLKILMDGIELHFFSKEPSYDIE